ncbi:hypothetical protein G7Y89_g7862 [Cudoniella acicularis]|uniref:Uncharacterized protein n=1 Tax=Cudoniella acicularis TaxID=354080 RepID=A0A8H4W451_9HELO|nr:hypothetical protein G7Y89_g7862 [Cudoniella acicularis]
MFIPSSRHRSNPSLVTKYSLKGLGFDTFQTKLLVIPSQVISIITLLSFTRLAGLTTRLTFNGIIGQVWALPLLIALHTLNTTTTNKWIVFAIVSLLLGHPSNHSVQASRNANTVRTRTVSTAMHNMCVQAGSIVYLNIYRTGAPERLATLPSIFEPVAAG